MKVLVLGSEGFIGKNVAEAFSQNHKVFRGSRNKENTGKNHLYIDLEKPEFIAEALSKVQPDVVVNCAGVVENSEKAKLNEIFTANLLQEIVDSKQMIGRIIILGSAAEYGIVRPEDMPVDEDTPLNPASDYGEAKIRETTTALEYRRNHNLPIIIARIFNPIGFGMNQRQLIPSLVRQIREIRSGKKDTVEVSRLDAKRDYIDIRDVANAIVAIAEGNPKEQVYNIGSGKSTANSELIDMVLAEVKLEDRPKFTETNDQSEPLYAVQADVSRIKVEFGWDVKYSLQETIANIANDSR